MARCFKFCMAFGLAMLLGGAGLFPAGCADGGKTISVKLGPGVKLRLIYIAPLKIYVGRYEVTNREFRCFRPAHTSGRHNNESLNGNVQPVVNVSWNDARDFCAWLNNTAAESGGGLDFRLPTEKEWETFATCGQQSDFPWGAWPPPKNLNYFGRENSAPALKLETADAFRVSGPVRKSGGNEWGLYGTAGNVWEWCADLDPDDAQSSARVLKGASWADSAPLFLRTTRRNANAADYQAVNVGFRVVAEPAPRAATGE